MDKKITNKIKGVNCLEFYFSLLRDQLNPTICHDFK